MINIHVKTMVGEDSQSTDNIQY